MPSAGGESLDEALSALVMLGFAKAPAEKALRGILRDNPAVSVEDLAVSYTHLTLPTNREV